MREETLAQWRSLHDRGFVRVYDREYGPLTNHDAVPMLSQYPALTRKHGAGIWCNAAGTALLRAFRLAVDAGTRPELASKRLVAAFSTASIFALTDSAGVVIAAEVIAASAVADALKANVEVPGATLVEGSPSLTIKAAFMTPRKRTSEQLRAQGYTLASDPEAQLIFSNFPSLCAFADGMRGHPWVHDAGRALVGALRLRLNKRRAEFDMKGVHEAPALREAIGAMREEFSDAAVVALVESAGTEETIAIIAERASEREKARRR